MASSPSIDLGGATALSFPPRREPRLDGGDRLGREAMAGTAITVGGTEPYPWPYDGCLEGDSLALVVAGAQQCFYDDSTDAERVATTLGRVAHTVTAFGGVVVLLHHCESPTPLGWPARRKPSLLPPPGAPAAALPPAFGRLVAGDGPATPLVVECSGLNGFHGSRLEVALRRAGRDHLIFGGFASELTVDTTLRGANDRGFECLVLKDGCAPIDPELGARALASVTMSGGIFGAIGTATELLSSVPPLSNRAPASLERNPR